VEEALIPCVSTCYWCSRKSWISCNISLLALLLVSGIYICAWYMSSVLSCFWKSTVVSVVCLQQRNPCEALCWVE